MPTDQFIEELTDGSPATTGDLFAIQRRVNGVWTDFFIRAENIAGAGVLAADITIASAVLGAQELLPQVTGKCYIILDPPIVQVTGNLPTSGTGNVFVGDGFSQQWNSQFADAETDAVYILNDQASEFNAGISSLNLTTDVFNGATLRVRFNFILADI
jgi:hypothetical protein